MSATTEPLAGMYQCGFCKAEYARSDHLVRHVRSHTKQRPFICTVCGKGFARQDLLKRHISTHKKGDKPDFNTQATMLTQMKRHSHRVSQACRSCAAKKVKCTNEKPCKRCRENGTSCDYEQGLGSPTQEHESTGPVLLATADERPSQPSVQLPAPVSRDDAFDNDPNFGLWEVNPGIGSGNAPEGQFTSSIQAAPDIDLMQGIIDSTIALPEFGAWIEIDEDPMLGDIDLSFLNGTDMEPPQSDGAGLSTSAALGPGPIFASTGMGAEAYRRSIVNRGWEPGREGHQEPEPQNLHLPGNAGRDDLAVSSPTMVTMVKKPLSLSTRDRLLALILRTTQPRVAERAVASFPSVEVLRDLLNFALAKMTDLQAIPMIHMPSIDLNEQRTELLAAFIAYGSVCSPSPALRKFGYAIQETVRIAINQLLEDQHAALREQNVCQAFYIQLYLAYWSATSRKIEMAECTSMLGASLLRRGKMLQSQTYAAPEHFLNLNGLSLQEQWLKWVEQESRKRLVYFAFTMDAHISASRDINVLFSYAELETPLPSAQALWEATSATKWRDLIQTSPDLRTQQAPSLSAILRRPYARSDTHKSLADIQCAHVIFLAGFWGLVHEYQQMNAVLRPVQSWNDFVLNSRYTELNAIMENFRAEATDLDDGCPETLILQEFMELHLDVSFYELSKYAGIGTDEDARLAVPYVQKWMENPQSRAALWHAGQIFRLTRSLQTGRLTDIYVIALYHAAITLWVWGLLSRSQGAAEDGTARTIALDGEESPAVTRYLKASRAIPGLTNASGEFLRLDNLTSAPDLANEIIIANWSSEPLPLTVEETSRLMQGISAICRQKFKGASG